VTCERTSLRNAWAKWRRLARSQRRLLLAAFALLGVARLLVLLLPFRWLAWTLGRHMAEARGPVSEYDRALALRVGRAVRSAAVHTPWRSVCLPQAVTAMWLLRRRCVPATLYLGVAQRGRNREGLVAHAWVRCGDLVLTGAAGHRRYTIVSTFS